jgi:hypothetical protein
MTIGTFFWLCIVMVGLSLLGAAFVGAVMLRGACGRLPGEAERDR